MSWAHRKKPDGVVQAVPRELSRSGLMTMQVADLQSLYQHAAGASGASLARRACAVWNDMKVIGIDEIAREGLPTPLDP